MKIIAYLKSNCQRSNDVRTVMNKYNLYYEEYENFETSDPRAASICVEIDGSTLADVSGKAIEKYLLSKGIVESVDKKSEATFPVDEEQEAIRSKITRFF